MCANPVLAGSYRSKFGEVGGTDFNVSCAEILNQTSEESIPGFERKEGHGVIGLGGTGDRHVE